MHFRLEVIGRFPTVAEARELQIDANSPVWLPTDGSSFNPRVVQMIRLINDYFMSGYRMA